jgi:hypothetical protein
MVVVPAVLALLLAGCAEDGSSLMPRCRADQRLALVAQSVPGASYVPCVAELPAGWSFADLDVDDDGSTITLESDRADRGVDVSLKPACDLGRATPIAPSDEGVRTYQRVDAISPRYVGRVIDVFPGGCVEASYDFERGPHVALVTELQQAMGLYSRRQLRQELKADLGITLDP